MIKEPTHPLSHSHSGLVYEHLKVWMDAYGSLPPNRHVSHIDGNKLNNQLENLVAESVNKRDVYCRKCGGPISKSARSWRCNPCKAMYFKTYRPRYQAIVNVREADRTCGKCGGLWKTGSKCMPCHREKIAARYRENPEPIRERLRRVYHCLSPDKKIMEISRLKKWNSDNPEKRRDHSHKHRAAKLLASSIGNHSHSDWLKICKAQKGKCANCGHRRNLTRDHKVPLSRGGSNLSINIQGLCNECNASKCDKLPIGIQPTIFDQVSSFEVIAPRVSSCDRRTRLKSQGPSYCERADS